MLRIKVFAYCSDIKIKVQISKSIFSNNNNEQNSFKLKIL